MYDELRNIIHWVTTKVMGSDREDIELMICDDFAQSAGGFYRCIQRSYEIILQYLFKVA